MPVVEREEADRIFIFCGFNKHMMDGIRLVASICPGDICLLEIDECDNDFDIDEVLMDIHAASYIFLSSDSEDNMDLTTYIIGYVNGACFTKNVYLYNHRDCDMDGSYSKLVRGAVTREYTTYVEFFPSFLQIVKSIV